MKRYSWLCLLILLAGCSSYTKKGTVIAGNDVNQKTTISVLAGFSTNDAGLSEMISREVAESFPQVELEWENTDWGTTFSSTLRARLSVGDVPDIIVGKAQDAVVYAKTGLLAAIPENVLQCIDERYRSDTSVDTVTYGAVYNVAYQGIIYNKNMFWRYGLTVPRTKRELDSVVSRFESVGIIPFASHFQEDWFTANIMMQFAINDLFTTQPDWGIRFNNGERSFETSHEMKNCFTNVKYIYAHSFPDSFIVQNSECDNRFIKEQSPMYLTGSWSVQAIHAVNSAMQIGIFPFPNEDGTAGLIVEPNLTFMKSASTAHEQLVDRIFELLFTDTEFAESVYSFTQSFPALKNMPMGYDSMIQSDITAYADSGRLIDASVGNNQLIWNFQSGMAKEITKWLQNKQSIEQLASECDKKRSDNK